MTSPPERYIQLAIDASKKSPCRSKRGVAIYDPLMGLWSTGYNRKPLGFACDGSETCKRTCSKEAIHAEQAALLAVGRSAGDKEMLHVKTIDGALVASGGPSCVECSKLIVESGIAGIWLFHKSGWMRYSAEVFHSLSLAASRLGDRCEVCGWTLAVSVKDGCVPGNCSYRPREGTAEYERIQRRRKELAENK